MYAMSQSHRPFCRVKGRVLWRLVVTSCVASVSVESISQVRSYRSYCRGKPAFCSNSPRRGYGSTPWLSKSHSGGDDQLQLDSIAEGLSKGNYQNVVVVMGAGASVSAGIPDFRTPGTGLYDQLQQYNLPFPEAIFDLDYFQQNPIPFLDFCRSAWPGQKNGPKPTLTHTFLKLLQDHNVLLRVYTQNIDGLESLAGVTDGNLVECHGHFRRATCVACHTPISGDFFYEQIVDQADTAPRCSTCGSLVKPDVVFFGEALPSRFILSVDSDIAKCDLMIVIGTSLQVMPVGALPSEVGPHCHRLLLNREEVGDFGNDLRDVSELDDCDNGVRKLCQLAGWEQELDETNAKLGQD